jgi:hypothetical protein
MTVVGATPEQSQELPAGAPGALGRAVPFQLRTGELYALRVSGPVAYRAGSGGVPSSADIVIDPSQPLHVFKADVGLIQLSALSGACTAALFPVVTP